MDELLAEPCETKDLRSILQWVRASENPQLGQTARREESFYR